MAAKRGMHLASGDRQSSRAYSYCAASRPDPIQRAVYKATGASRNCSMPSTTKVGEAMRKAKATRELSHVSGIATVNLAKTSPGVSSYVRRPHNST